MTALRRWAADPLVPIFVVALALLAVACGPATPASPKPSASGRASAAAPSPDLTAVPGGKASQTVELPTTTETEFGRIWDALPPSFPKLRGQVETDTGAGPTSGSFAVGMTAANASQVMAAALRALGWTTDVGSALEDGTIVLEARGERDGCAAEVRFTPRSGTVSMSVLYGAECPFG